MARKFKLLQIAAPSNIERVLLPATRGVRGQLRRRMIPRMRVALLRHLKEIVRDTIRNTKLKRRTGRSFKSLREGIRVFGSGRLASVRGQVSGLVQLKAHEFGATIKPVKARKLAIPLKAALRANGEPKRKGPNSWRSAGSFIWKSKKTGQSFVVIKRRGRIVLLYALVNQVKIKPTLGLRKRATARRLRLARSWGTIMVTELRQFDLFALTKLR